MGEVDKEVKEYLDGRVGVKYEGEIPLVQMETTNTRVDEINEKRLREIEGEERIYHAIDVGKDSDLTLLDRNCLAAKKIVIKKGASVMLLSNVFKPREISAS